MNEFTRIYMNDIMMILCCFRIMKGTKFSDQKPPPPSSFVWLLEKRGGGVVLLL